MTHAAVLNNFMTGGENMSALLINHHFKTLSEPELMSLVGGWSWEKTTYYLFTGGVGALGGAAGMAVGGAIAGPVGAGVGLVLGGTAGAYLGDVLWSASRNFGKSR